MSKSLLLVALMALSAFAQDAPKSKVVDKPVVSSPAPSLDLAKAEVDAGVPLASEISRLEGEIVAGLNAVLTATSNAEILAGARQWREGFKDRNGVQARFNEWLVGVQTAHNCEKCALDLSDPKAPRLRRPDKK